MTQEENAIDTPTPEGLIASLTVPDSVPKHRVTLDIAPQAIIKVLITIGSVWLLLKIFSVLILIVFSLMLVATFNPFVRKLQARVGRPRAILAVVSGLVALMLGTLALLIPPLLSQGEKLGENASVLARQIQQTLARHHININIQAQSHHLLGKANGVSPEFMGMLSSALGVATGFATVAILTIYLLIEGPQVGTSLMRLLPRKDRLSTRKLVDEIGTQVGGYMRGQLITSGMAGLFCFATCWLVGAPHALALGALAAIADVIPLIGLLIGLVPAALMALTVSPIKAVIVIVAYLVYHQVEGHFIAPKVYGTALGLSLSVIVISLLIGAEIMGIVGAVLVLPIAAAIPSIIAFLQERQESYSLEEEEPHLP